VCRNGEGSARHSDCACHFCRVCHSCSSSFGVTVWYRVDVFRYLGSDGPLGRAGNLDGQECPPDKLAPSTFACLVRFS